MRDFARATGRLAKTDRIDAYILADFGKHIKPVVRPLKGEGLERISAAQCALFSACAHNYGGAESSPLCS